MLMHSEILALTLQHARPRRCRSPACFSIPSHFLFLLNYPRPKSLAPLESFHGRRLKSGSLRAFASLPPSLPLSSYSPEPALVNLEARVLSSRSHREIFFPKEAPSWKFYSCLKISRFKFFDYRNNYNRIYDYIIFS